MGKCTAIYAIDLTELRWEKWFTPIIGNFLENYMRSLHFWPTFSLGKNMY
jgi:hypothetical protein